MKESPEVNDSEDTLITKAGAFVGGLLSLTSLLCQIGGILFFIVGFFSWEILPLIIAFMLYLIGDLGLTYGKDPRKEYLTEDDTTNPLMLKVSEWDRKRQKRKLTEQEWAGVPDGALDKPRLSDNVSESAMSSVAVERKEEP